MSESYLTLVEWFDEMQACEKVDPPNKSKYYNTEAEITAVQALRLLNFIRRRGLAEQFIAEDAGKR